MFQQNFLTCRSANLLAMSSAVLTDVSCRSFWEYYLDGKMTASAALLLVQVKDCVQDVFAKVSFDKKNTFCIHKWPSSLLEHTVNNE